MFPPRHVVLKDGSQVLIRTGTEADAEAIQKCVLAYVEDGEGQLWARGEFHPTVEEERVWIKGITNHPDELLLVAEHDGEIIGNIDLHVGRRVKLAHTGEFGMSCMPNWRGLGLGTFLIAQLLKWARENQHLEKVNLRVLGSNTRGIALYKKMGFHEEGRRKKEVKQAPGVYDDEIFMGIFV